MGLIRVVPAFTVPPAGQGYVSGLVTVNGTPDARRVEVRHARTRAVISTTFSASDGTYRLDGLDPTDEFEVIARDHAAVYNNVIAARVLPWPYSVLSVTGAFSVNDATNTLDGGLPIYGGEGNSVAVTSGAAPSGITFAVGDASPPSVPSVGLYVLASGTATPGSYTWTLTVTAANGSSKAIACSATFT